MPNADQNHLHADSIHNNPEWLVKAGLWIGVIILLSLVILAILSGALFPRFICTAYPLLAAIFAFGAAIAGAFIGGDAAAHGRFGTVEYSVKGGTAFLFISFAMFVIARPDSKICEPPEPPKDKEVRITFQNTPHELQFGGLLDFFWRQDREDDGVRTLYVLAKNESKSANLNLTVPGQSAPECTIQIRTARTVKDIENGYEQIPYDGGDISFRVDYGWVNDFMNRHQACEDAKRRHEPCQSASQVKQNPPACFRYQLENARTGGRDRTAGKNNNDNRYVDGSFVVVPNEGKLFFAAAQFSELYPTFSPTNSSIRQYANFVLSANAQIAQQNLIQFSALKNSLSDLDGNTRTAAQIYLAQNFANYEAEVNAELFLPNQNPDYISGLLEGLIGGIDADTVNAFVPGRHRDLSEEIRLLQGKESGIVTMSGSENISIRRQARKIIQRYPIDVFDGIYSEMLSEKTCDDYQALDKQAVIYTSIFYYYNRIVQFAFDRPFDTASQRELDRFFDKGSRLADCLIDPVLKIDEATLLYAKAFAYNEHKNDKKDDKQVSAKALEFAQKFLMLAQASHGNARFYSQSQIEAAKRIEDSIQPASSFQQPATPGQVSPE